MRVAFVASECSPIAKVGGLADVVGSLPKALKKLDMEPLIIIPRYGIIDSKKFPSKIVNDKLEVEFDDKLERFKVYQTLLPNSDVPVYLIDHPLLSSDGVYISTSATVDSMAEVKRFSFFSNAAIEFIENLKDIDILHLNDWHTSLIPHLIDLKHNHNPKISKIATVLTIHNMGHSYQGISDLSILKVLDIKPTDTPDLAWDAKDGEISFLEQGIVTADMVNTVSPTYAKEIATEEFCEGLCHVIEAKGDRVWGILNGIDYQIFNPASDKKIAKNYRQDDWRQGKKVNKKALQEKMGLQKDENLFLIGKVTRLDDQKGINFVINAIDKLMALPYQMVILGMGAKKYVDAFAKIKAKYPKKFNYSNKFDPILASMIYAGSDAFLMPSKFEPCGLGQMISMAYGTPPIVRATGGLKDTVVDSVTGFTFDKLGVKPMMNAINRAYEHFQDKVKWTKIVDTAMKQDFSWDQSAREYVKLYRKAIAIHQK